jgi:hypothetical protein
VILFGCVDSIDSGRDGLVDLGSGEIPSLAQSRGVGGHFCMIWIQHRDVQTDDEMVDIVALVGRMENRWLFI